MTINPKVQEILKEYNINIDAGIIVLLGLYYNLDVDSACLPEAVSAINMTKIVVKDYSEGVLKWNVPLFLEQETEWKWVATKYNAMWNINRDRKDGERDVLRRMQKFFATYPQYRKEDVKRATEAYFRSVKDVQYLKSSAKFIFEGAGVMKKSLLLAWCEKTANKENNSNLKGKIIR